MENPSNPEARKHVPAADRWKWWQWSPLVLTVAIVGVVLIVRGLENVVPTSKIEEDLNDRYDQTVQLERGSTGFSPARPYETLVIDGVLRPDCHVINDQDPVIECEEAVALTTNGQ